MKDGELTGKVIGCAIEVHKELGPGLLESTYEECLVYELTQIRIDFKRQLELPVTYKDNDIQCGYRIDLLIENELIVELKSVSELLPIHEAQLLTYLKLSKITLGLLINFNTRKIKDGIRRLVL